MRAAGTEIVAVAALPRRDAGADLRAAPDLALLIAASGAIPLFSGAAVRAGGAPGAAAAAAPGRRRSSAARVMAIVPDRRLAARGRALQPGDVRLGPGDPGRLPHAGQRSGCYEGPVRAHNLLYALGGALAVPVVPDGVALRGGRRRAAPARAGRCAARRYTLALFVPRLRDADRAGRADPRGLARRALRGRRRRAGDPRLLLAALRRPGGDARLPGGRRPRARAWR